MRLELDGAIVLTPAIPELAEQAEERRELIKLLEANVPSEVLHEKISHFFETDENNIRLLLYLPFHLLPTGDSEFAKDFKNAWIKLLDESDVAANFTDGDCLEPGMGDPPRVRKAAHLIPQLRERGIITNEDVHAVLDKARTQGDQELVDSIMEGLGITAKRIEKTLPVGQVSAKRVKWLARVEREKLLDKEARERASPNHPNPIVALRSVEYAADADDYLRLAEKFWQTGSDEIQNEIVGGLCRLVNGRVFPKEVLHRFNVQLPDFTAPFPFPIEDMITKDYRFLAEAAKKISSHPVLSKYIYPFFVIIGSRQKGYAEVNADKDAAMFFKPDTPKKMREKLFALLRQDVPELANLDNMPEFWLDENEEGYTFKNFQDDWFTLAGPEQIHFLLHGIWLGQDDELVKVHQNILKRYLNLNRFGNQKEEVRTHLLRRLEMDALQYRLMHKGYRRFYPSIGETTFFDPGYRRIASLIFLNRVFLPDLG